MSRAVGNAFEGLAVQYLESRGAKILARNYAARGGEIDVICRVGDTLCFVEVKARLTPNGPSPGEEITPAKIKRICRAALSYLTTHGGVDQACRFDAVLIDGEDIRWIRNAFDYMA